MDFDGRGATRISSSNLIAYRLFDSEGRICQEGMVKTVDISRTGIAIHSFDPMEEDRKIILKIGIDEDIVNASGVVRNIHKIDDQSYQIGIEFDYLSDEDLNKIALSYPNVLK